MKSLTFKITCRFAALVTFTTAAVLVTVGFVLDHEIEHGLDVLHDIEVVELRELLGEDGTLTPMQIAARIEHDADSDAALFAIQVADASGNVLFRSDNLGDTILPSATQVGQHWTTNLPFMGRVHLSSYAVGPWRIHIGSPLEPAERVLREYVRMAVPLLLGAGLVSVGMGYAFSRATLRPLRAIEQTARRIRGDNLAERVPVPGGKDELSSLAELLNQMFDRLEASFVEVQRFSADVSHEFKTPLALIRLSVEKVRARLEPESEGAAALSDALEEIGRLHHVIDRLLFVAKAQSGAMPLVRVEVEMRRFITDFAEDARALCEDRGLHFDLTRSDEGYLHAEPELLRQMLLNLISNAVAASATGRAVQLESIDEGGTWLLRVLDEGTGIPEAELPRVFERFVRVAGAAGAHQMGHGLGLAICKSVAALHHGAITAQNRDGQPGLAVTVRLPKTDHTASIAGSK